jgi:hypothetical protein
MALYRLGLCKSSPPGCIHGNEWGRFRLCRLAQAFALASPPPDGHSGASGGAAEPAAELAPAHGGARGGTTEPAVARGRARPPTKSTAPAAPPSNPPPSRSRKGGDGEEKRPTKLAVGEIPPTSSIGDPSHGQRHRSWTEGKRRRKMGMSGNFTSSQHRDILSHYAVYQTRA